MRCWSRPPNDDDTKDAQHRGAKHRSAKDLSYRVTFPGLPFPPEFIKVAREVVPQDGDRRVNPRNPYLDNKEIKTIHEFFRDERNKTALIKFIGADVFNRILDYSWVRMKFIDSLWRLFEHLPDKTLVETNMLKGNIKGPELWKLLESATPETPRVILGCINVILLGYKDQPANVSLIDMLFESDKEINPVGDDIGKMPYKTQSIVFQTHAIVKTIALLINSYLKEGKSIPVLLLEYNLDTLGLWDTQTITRAVTAALVEKGYWIDEIDQGMNGVQYRLPLANGDAPLKRRESETDTDTEPTRRNGTTTALQRTTTAQKIRHLNDRILNMYGSYSPDMQVMMASTLSDCMMGIHDSLRTDPMSVRFAHMVATLLQLSKDTVIRIPFLVGHLQQLYESMPNTEARRAVELLTFLLEKSEYEYSGVLVKCPTNTPEKLLWYLTTVRNWVESECAKLRANNKPVSLNALNARWMEMEVVKFEWYDPALVAMLLELEGRNFEKETPHRQTVAQAVAKLGDSLRELDYRRTRAAVPLYLRQWKGERFRDNRDRQIRKIRDGRVAKQVDALSERSIERFNSRSATHIREYLEEPTTSSKTNCDVSPMLIEEEAETTVAFKPPQQPPKTPSIDSGAAQLCHQGDIEENTAEQKIQHGAYLTPFHPLLTIDRR